MRVAIDRRPGVGVRRREDPLGGLKQLNGAADVPGGIVRRREDPLGGLKRVTSTTHAYQKKFEGVRIRLAD